MTDELAMRTATAEDLPELATLISGAFLHDVEEETLDLHRLVDEPERNHVVTDEGRIVGTGAVLTRELTIPGGVVPAAHVSAVAVASTHRRRGLLTSIMTAQLDAVRKQTTEPIAVLWASEGAIYGRFGYGMACWQVHYEIPTRETMLPAQPSTGRLRQAVPRDVIGELAQVYDRAWVGRPGRSSRSDGGSSLPPIRSRGVATCQRNGSRSTKPVIRWTVTRSGGLRAAGRIPDRRAW